MPLGRIQGITGRVVLVVFIGMLTAWALALLKQCQQYVPDQLPQVDTSDLSEQRRRLIELAPQSLLEQFYRELGVSTRRLDPTGLQAPFEDELVCVLHPRAQAPDRLIDTLEKHVKRGGRLVVFTDSDLDFLARFGLTTSPATTGYDDAFRAAATVEDAHVKRIAAPHLLKLAGVGRPMVPLLKLENRVVAGMVGYGEGSVTVVIPRMADYAWIEREDNAIFLANLVLNRPFATGVQSPVPAENVYARPSQVAVLDYDAEVLRHLYALETSANSRMEEARRRWQYDSLWSLIRANPVSAALIQLVLALLVFGCARARRLGGALPDRLARVEMPGSLAARANLFERSGAYRLAISRAVRHTNRWLAVRLGLSGDPTAEEIRGSLETLSPRAAARYAGLVQCVHQVSDGKLSADERSLTGVWYLIDALRRELPQ